MDTTDKPKTSHNVRYRNRLLAGAALVRQMVNSEFSRAGIAIDGFRWNDALGGGLLLDFPFQFFNVRVGDWISPNAPVTTDALTGKLGLATFKSLEPLVATLVQSYATHAFRQHNRRAGYIL